MTLARRTTACLFTLGLGVTWCWPAGAVSVPSGRLSNQAGPSGSQGPDSPTGATGTTGSTGSPGIPVLPEGSASPGTSNVEHAPETTPTVAPPGAGYVGGEALRGTLALNQDGIAQTVSGADAALGAAAVLDRRGLQDLWIRARFADSLATAQAAHETQDRAEAALTDARAGVAEAARALVTARAQAQQRVAEAYRGSTTPRLAAALSGDGSAPAMAMARARVYVQAIRADDVQVMKRWHQLERRTSSHARSLASRVISARAASSQADAAVVELRLAGYLAGANTPTGPGPGIAGPGGVTGPSGPTGLTGSSGAGQIVGGAVAESQFWNIYHQRRSE